MVMNHQGGPSRRVCTSSNCTIGVQ